jgi:hypothetical protein
MARHLRRPRTASAGRWDLSKTAGLSAAMHGTARGEHIAREVARPNARDRTGAETLRGLFRASRLVRRRGRMKPSESRLTLWGADRAHSSGSGSAKRVRGDREGSRSRPSWEDPGRARTQGSIRQVGALITRRPARDSRKGQSPGAAAWRDGLSLRRQRYRQEKRQVGSSGRRRLGNLSRGESSEG